MELTPRRRRALATVLAMVLAVESVAFVGAAAVASGAPRGPHALPEASPVGLVLAGSGANEDRTPTGVADLPADRLLAPAFTGPIETAAVVAPAAAVPSPPARASMPERAPRAATSAPTAQTSRGSSSSGSAYAGRNHVWIPALRINRSVASFPCDRSRPPDNLLYRWGCAGANNVYLMGHASSVLKPLHDAYVSGRLKVGMKAWYADSQGRVRAYAVKWWKVTLPDAQVSWAWAAQSKRSMTLQTCVGANSTYRLVVRLVEVDG